MDIQKLRKKAHSQYFLNFHFDHQSFANFSEKTVQTFFGWVFGFGGKVQILAPAEGKEQYRQMIQNEFDIINKEQE